MKQNISVISAGAWGTTLAMILTKKGLPVKLWAYPSELAIDMQKHKENKTYLPGIRIPESLEITPDIEAAVKKSRIIIFVPPSKVFRSVVTQFAKYIPQQALIISATKGLEKDTNLRMSQILEQELPAKFHSKISVLSGPNLASEIAHGLPATTVLASKSKKVRARLQSILTCPNLRVYTNRDVVGVELGGTLKNVIALA
ncbi:MAG: glycerol-3-phosphate dehydrogenase, partial [bacterium]